MKKKHKIYIVGAVSGVKNWKDKFIATKKRYTDRTNEIRTPMDYPEGLTQRKYMVLSCESVFWADEIIVTPDWVNSKGTKAEIALATSVGTPVVYEVTSHMTTDSISATEIVPPNKPREAIAYFASEMELELQKHDGNKTNYQNPDVTIDYLRKKMQKKITRLHEDFFNLNSVEVQNNCIHAANYLMMISDRIALMNGEVPTDEYPPMFQD